MPAPHDSLPHAPGVADTVRPGLPKPRRGRAGEDSPLGSLTQPQHRSREGCRACGSDRVTRLAMQLTDGTPVDFLSCHLCESRSWEHDGRVLDVDTVLERTRRPV